MTRLYREPLVAFLALSALLFVGYGLASRRTGSARRIVVTRQRIDSLAAEFARTWQRRPTGDELNALIRDDVRDEVCVREAIALGLGRDDSVIRRRLRQKLEFVAQEAAVQAEPTEAELRTYLDGHVEAYRTEATFTFRQVHLDPQRRGAGLARDAERLLARLRREGAGADISGLGDSRLLERQFNALPEGELKKQFGDAFAARLAALPVGRWEGPIPSGYGEHLVFLEERREGRVPELGEVRDAVHRDWADARRHEADDAYYRALLSRYTVVVESGPPAPTSPR